MSGASSSNAAGGKSPATTPALGSINAGGFQRLSIDDPIIDGLPKLDRHSNYQNWAITWKRALRAMRLWKVVNGDIKEPFNEEWRHIDYQAHALLMRAVHGDIQSTVVFADSANAAWKALKSSYDRSVAYLLGEVLDTKMQDGGSISDHLETFDSNWATLAIKCRLEEDDSLAKSLKPLTASDEAMAEFLLSSLPKSMRYAVKVALLAKDVVTSEDVRQQLFKIETLDRGTRAQPSPSEMEECSWCKKRKMNYQGHHYTDCRKLKEKQMAKKG